jgi:hypothetical protein
LCQASMYHPNHLPSLFHSKQERMFFFVSAIMPNKRSFVKGIYWDEKKYMERTRTDQRFLL